ncbi:hypothetical protein ABZW96_15480 [Nocardia sp. NPDC004168]|uniref:DUF6973 domain-containing protein n=1 Tax=Nocardia sp. NPDC004168 TaxID=3154452 RepID=UPI0033B41016
MSGGNYVDALTVPLVLSWDPRAAIAIADKFKEKASQLDDHTHKAAVSIDMSYTYYRGKSGESARDRGHQDREHARRTKEVLVGIQQQIYKHIASIVDYIDVIREKKAEAEESEFDLFVRDDGGVDSRMSNREVLLKFGPSGLVEKEGYEAYLTAQIRAALTAVQQADKEGADQVRRWLEELSDEVKRGATAMPEDPELAKILNKYQTAPSKSGASLWPSGLLLTEIRLLSPDFQPTLMTPEEAALVSTLLMKPTGVADVAAFFELKSQAENAAKAAYPDIPSAWADDHGDAYRHMYWNALMTQKYGEEWTASFATAHEGTGANTPAREAMDLYNNEQGRKIAVDHPDASPEELQRLVRQRIDAGQAIVIDNRQQIEWSNRVPIGDTVSPHSSDIPLPGAK